MSALFFTIIYWNVSPEIISSPIAIRWYSLMFGLSFFLSYYIFHFIFKKEGKNLDDLDDLLMYMFIATIVGARLGHCIFYDFEYYFIQHPEEIFKIWEGGLASHGALFGIVLAVYIFSKRKKGYSFLWLLDRIAWVSALATTFIRIGNFFNSEIVGIPTDGSWGVVFMQNGEDFPRIPIMLFESFCYFTVFISYSIIYLKTNGQFREGLFSAMFFTLMLLYRFICEFWKADYGEKIWLGLNNGQLLSIPIFFAGIALFVYIYFIKKPPVKS
jgi:prolipoprotein diacylglyceryl transferase